MTYKRRVSVMELAHATAGSRLSDPNQKITVLVIEGEGSLDENKLRQTIEKLAEACPTSRLVLRGAWVFRHWSAVGALPKLKVIEGNWDGRSHINAEFADTSMDLFSGPTVEIILYKSDKTRLIFRLHHAITDGMGALQYIKNFFRVLRSEDPISWESQLIDTDMADRLSCDHKAEFVPVALSPTGKPTAGAPVTRGEWYRITTQKKSLLLLTRTIVALAEIARRQGEGKVRFMVPVDLRRHLKENEHTMANLATPMILDIEEDDDYRSISTKFVRQLAEKREAMAYSKLYKLANWMPFSLLEKMRKSVSQTRIKNNSFPMSGLITPLGEANLSEYSTDSFTASSAFVLPMIVLDIPLFVSIWSNKNCTELTFGAPNSMTSDNRLKNLAEEIKSVLESD